MSRLLQFWCKFNTRRIVKTCAFRFLRDYYSDSLDVMFPQFSNHFLPFPMVFSHVSLSVCRISSGVSTVSPKCFPRFLFRFCDLHVLYSSVCSHFNVYRAHIYNIYRGLSFSMYTQFSKKYPLICTRTCAYQGVKMLFFSESFLYVLNGWSHSSHFNTARYLIHFKPVFHFCSTIKGV